MFGCWLTLTQIIKYNCFSLLLIQNQKQKAKQHYKRKTSLLSFKTQIKFSLILARLNVDIKSFTINSLLFLVNRAARLQAGSLVGTGSRDRELARIMGRGKHFSSHRFSSLRWFSVPKQVNTQTSGPARKLQGSINMSYDPSNIFAQAQLV